MVLKAPYYVYYLFTYCFGSGISSHEQLGPDAFIGLTDDCCTTFIHQPVYSCP